MRYVSTRGATAPMSFQEAVITGQAPDGGLLVPERFPDVSAHLAGWRDLSFQALALEVISRYVDDISRDDLKEMIEAAYASFDAPAVTPLVDLGDYAVLELFHGPTLAFKDVALQFLGRLFEHILAERGGRLNILGATSGDTGSSAIAGVRGRRNIDIFVLYPHGKTSRLQELQMTTVQDDNVHCLAIDGSFDDCQAIMKTTFNDLPFKERHALGAVNSLNWARVVAQVVYYFYAALRHDEPITVSVPTGNFGNIFAGYVARAMGAPIRRLVLATNENDILTRFFCSGVYQRGRVHHTLSPSMDIQVASNFERYVFLRLGRDPSRLQAFMRTFAQTGCASLDEGALTDQGAVDDLIIAASVGTAATLETIKTTYDRHGYVVDPHTAVGIGALGQVPTEGPVVCVATAHPAKFPESVNEAIGKDVAHHPSLDALDASQARATRLPADVDAVKAFVAEHARAA